MSESSKSGSDPAAVDFGAPTIAFDGTAGLLHKHGLFSIVLITSRPTILLNNSVPIVPVVACQLQTSREGLLALQTSIEKLLLATAELPSVPQ